MQSLFNSADGLANCSADDMQFWLWRFISDEALAVASSNILFIIMHLYLLILRIIIDKSGSVQVLNCWYLFIHSFYQLRQSLYRLVQLLITMRCSLCLCPTILLRLKAMCSNVIARTMFKVQFTLVSNYLLFQML